MASEALTTSALFPSREIIPPLREVVAQLFQLVGEARQAVLERVSSLTKVDEAPVITCRYDEHPDQPDSNPSIVGALK